MNALPPRKVNGGLYTGEPARGSWGNHPVEPDPNPLYENLKSANPPPGYTTQTVSLVRPGNNYVEYPYHKLCTTYNLNNLCSK